MKNEKNKKYSYNKTYSDLLPKEKKIDDKNKKQFSMSNVSATFNNFITIFVIFLIISGALFGGYKLLELSKMVNLPGINEKKTRNGEKLRSAEEKLEQQIKKQILNFLNQKKFSNNLKDEFEVEIKQIRKNINKRKILIFAEIKQKIFKTKKDLSFNFDLILIKDEEFLHYSGTIPQEIPLINGKKISYFPKR